MSGEPHTLVCFAVVQESDPFRQRNATAPGLRILVTGMGPTNAARAFTEALREQPTDRVLTCGFAGGLDPAYRRNELFFETESAEWSRLLTQAGGIRPARFLCADRIAITAAEKADLRRQSQADLVEMESGIIQRLCRERGIPCATLRVISDAANDNLPLDFNSLLTPDHRLSGFKLARALLQNPGSIPGLVRLGRHSSEAAQQLADALERLLISRVRV